MFLHSSARFPQDASLTDRRQEHVDAFWNKVLGRAARPILPLNETGIGTPFYCVHPLSGDAACFRDLAALLGPAQRFYGIQMPTPKRNAEGAVSVEAIAEYYADAVAAFQPDGPLALGGWSAGAVIALEVAQLLRGRGRDVALLVAIEGVLYNTGAGLSPWNPLYSCKLVGNLPRWFRDDLMQNWSFRLFAKRVVSKVIALRRIALSRLQGDSQFRAHSVQGFMDTSSWSDSQVSFMKALFDALCRYVPREYGGRVLVYAAKTEPLYHLLQVGAGWSKIAARSEVVQIGGTHVSLNEKPHIERLADHLRRRLAECSPAAPP
ncbi:MAG: alpha/beta fold hydrolase [Stellaceae bacterium]